MTKFDMSLLPNTDSVYAEFEVTPNQSSTSSNLFDHPSYRCAGTKGVPGEINIKINIPAESDSVDIYHTVRDALLSAGIHVTE
tara:strand:- start:1279 stop:1527 length:249 start_codon:yes stop_codon:yes gene_type:complete